MPIYRLSAQECLGIIIDDDPIRSLEIVGKAGPVLAEIISRAMEEFNLVPQRCEPGVINVTPSYWKHNRMDYKLKVADSGESALFYAIPKSMGRAGLLAHPGLEGQVITEDLKPHIARLPEESAYAPPVMGPIADDSRIRLHELIVYGSQEFSVL